jgi:hypothetical protein
VKARCPPAAFYQSAAVRPMMTALRLIVAPPRLPIRRIGGIGKNNTVIVCHSGYSCGVIETIDYKGYRLEVQRHGPGWKMFIYSPGGRTALTTIPYTMMFSEKDGAIAEAKTIVDAGITSN